MRLPSIVVLISGSGSNLQALIDNQGSDYKITHVISNKKAAYGLERAAKASIPTSVHNIIPYRKRHPDDVSAARADFDKELAQRIKELKPDLVVCAGWMHILSSECLRPLKEAGVPLINLHPALPGAFDGAHAIDRAYDAFQKGEITKTGCMIHWVIEEVDRGEPLLIKEIEMKKEESQDDLETRIHSVEHVAIVEGTNMALAHRA
ncbi:Bifunctional purine biosynthetic protein ADE5,7 [Saitoella coloradoensis]